MKYFILLLGSFLYLIGSLTMAYSLWDIEDNWIWKFFLVLCPAISSLFFIWMIQSYSKVQLENSFLKVTKFFTTKTFDLNELTSWNENHNLIRISFRKISLRFNKENATIIDFFEGANVDQLYHYLRTHFPDKKRKKP